MVLEPLSLGNSTGIVLIDTLGRETRQVCSPEFISIASECMQRAVEFNTCEKVSLLSWVILGAGVLLLAIDLVVVLYRRKLLRQLKAKQEKPGQPPPEHQP